jgi:hypothetical protein
MIDSSVRAGRATANLASSPFHEQYQPRRLWVFAVSQQIDVERAQDLRSAVSLSARQLSVQPGQRLSRPCRLNLAKFPCRCEVQQQEYQNEKCWKHEPRQRCLEIEAQGYSKHLPWRPALSKGVWLMCFRGYRPFLGPARRVPAVGQANRGST